MELRVQFKNEKQREFYYTTARCQCFSGGFNNGKTFIGCLKAISLLLSYSNYRMIIARQTFTDLKRTTMETFLKLCPTELVMSHNSQDGLTVLSNGSQIYWLHLDKIDESTLRGIEPNSILVDQAEEMEEKVYDVLDGRLGRWDGAIVPPEILKAFPVWPYKNDRPVVPSYLMLLCNPESEFHFIYRKYHTESIERNPEYFFTSGEWDRNLGSEETYDQAILRDQEFIDKYVYGKWGSSNAAIHFIRKDSLLDYSPELIKLIKEKGALTRVIDHGSSAPTCCVWFASVQGVYIAYREYYVANQRISYHRKEITSLSENEEYVNNFCDPHMYDKASQAKGGLYSVVDEYNDTDLDGPPLFWQKADNNEFSTRNRINELLSPSGRFRHPLTQETPAPGIYFIQSGLEYPNGCREIIRQTGAQRKKLLGTYEGKSLYTEDRDDDIVDHAYDTLRYFVAMHSSQPRVEQKRPPRNSFAYYNEILKQQLSRRGIYNT